MAAKPLGERVARVVVIVVAVFLLAGAAFAALVCVSLLVPGTALDALWAMKAGSREQFAGFGVGGIALLAGLVVVLIPTAAGLLRRARWSRWVAILLLAANVIPDVVRAFASDPTVFLPVVPVAAIMVYLALPVVGRTFGHRGGDGRGDGDGGARTPDGRRMSE